MFSAINSVNWGKLKQAHGYADYVPQALNDLISGEKEKEEAAYWKLDNHIVLQGDLYESAFYILPFLYDILESNITNGRDRVYDLLFEIANGYETYEVQCNLNGKSLSLTDACRSSILEHSSLFLSEVKNVNSELRDKALELLVSLDELSEELLEELSIVLETEEKNHFRSLLREAIEDIERNVLESKG